LFELANPLDHVRISDEIQSTLLNYEPRISNIQVTVSNYPDSNELNATIQYDITGMASPSQTVDVILQPARV
jgi:predicted component of type VI protein secretion system